MLVIFLGELACQDFVSCTQSVFWFVNENLVEQSAANAAFHWKAKPSSYVMRAVDDQGRADARSLKVELVK